MKDTHEQFLKKVWDNNQHYREGKFEILGEYEGYAVKILCRDKYGYILVIPSSLKRGSITTIQSAIDKTSYFINKAKEVHGNSYGYDKVEYIGNRDKIIVTCPIHDDFLISPDKHFQNRGCPKCGADRISKAAKENPPGWRYKDWESRGEKSKNFDSYKLYIIKCWNEEEKFYKIGKTYTTVQYRFRNYSIIPYDYEIIKEIKGEAGEISTLEKQLQKQNKEYKYLPKIKFNGRYECFTKINKL